MIIKTNSLSRAAKVGVSTLAICTALVYADPALAGHDGNVAGAVAAGIIGGAALGALAAGAARPAPPPAVVYPEQPIYAEPPPGPPPSECWYQRQRVWDGYAWVWRRVQICN
jgi:hypothetical protein